MTIQEEGVVPEFCTLIDGSSAALREVDSLFTVTRWTAECVVWAGHFPGKKEGSHCAECGKDRGSASVQPSVLSPIFTFGKEIL